MDALPIRPAPLARAVPATPRGASRAAGAKAAAAPSHAAAHPVHGLPPAGPEDVALIAEQAAFDRMMQLRAELQREANALRDLAMEQVKRDDSVMSQWIKLI